MTRFGVNYTPRDGWFHSWANPNMDEIARDFDAIAGLGMDHIRIFPLWPLLQPNRTLISDRGIADVTRVVDLAGERGLDVCVDVLNGHLSSYDFLPSWVTSWHYRNLFTDPEVIDGEVTLAKRLASELADRSNVMGLCLGNEFGQFAAPRHPHQHVITPAQADAWLETLFDAITAEFPHGMHQHSFDDDLWFVESHPFTPAHAVTRGAITTVHSWVFMQVGPRFGVDHPALGWFARYLLELANAYSAGQERQIWLQEVGAPAPWVSPAHAPKFAQDTVATCRQVPNLFGITWWCSHDVSSKLADFPALEYSLGLFDENNRPKPVAHALAEVMQAPVDPSTTTTTLQVPADPVTGQGRAIASPSRKLFGDWMEAALQGDAPRLEIVSPTELDDRPTLQPGAAAAQQ